MVPLDAAASVVLLRFRQSYGLGFVAPNGRIVTCYHVVADEAQIVAHLADGRALPVRGVSALDVRRDLAVLDVGLLDATPARAGGGRLAPEGEGVFVFGMVAGEWRTRWAEAKVNEVQTIAASLTVYALSGDVPADASGGPLIAGDGTTLGVVTVAASGGSTVGMAVPWRYVDPLLRQNRELPLSVLSSESRAQPQRRIPDHPLSLLKGSTTSGLEVTTELIAEAIRVGAPAYNDGDVAKCLSVYSDAARRLIDTRDDCPGVQTALRSGLHRASSLKDVDHQAWAMRDAFDGLLLVIEKYLKAHRPPKSSKTTLLN
jgi:serine protease Do